ncbi:hypothetical protein [Kaarinaea lacus]
MKTKSKFQVSIVAISSMFVLGCSSLDDKTDKPADPQGMSLGNSENVKVVKNPTMMFHDIVVNQTAGGAELEGKVHIRGHQDYVPGHIDIAVIDKTTGENISNITTDFDSRIARHGRYNFKHANNIGTRLPGVDPEKATIVIAYHYSNVDRLSRVDCGANVALASVNAKDKMPDINK